MSGKRKVQTTLLKLSMLAVLMLACNLMAQPVQAADTFTVSNTNDGGDGSLRQAIINVNAAGEGNINFAKGLSGTISLLSELPSLNSDITLKGPGAENLTIERAVSLTMETFRILTINIGKTVSIRGLTIQKGAADFGGGIFNQGTLNLSSCAIASNSVIEDSSSGGGIENRGTLNLDNTTVTNNFATNHGGGISNTGILNITNSKVTANRALDGAGINNTGTLSISNSRIADNQAAGGGGGILNQRGERQSQSGSLIIDNSTIANNSAGNGGGINNNTNGSLTIRHSRIINNLGTGIFNWHRAIVSNCTIAGNSESGIENIRLNADNIGSITVANSTIADNSTLSQGGGIFNLFGTATVTNSTIANNYATLRGGGIFNDNGTVNLQSTIVARNNAFLSTNDDIKGNITSLGHNLIAETTGTNGYDTSQGDIINQQPGFELDSKGNPLLKDNGGLTPTIALLPSSPAIDQGKNGGLALATEQRGSGYTRTYDDSTTINAIGGDGTDIGAFEMQIPLLITSIFRSGKNLFINGTGFVEGTKIFIDGEQAKTIFVSNTNLTGKKAAKGLMSGSRITVRNPDGFESNAWIFE